MDEIAVVGTDMAPQQAVQTAQTGSLGRLVWTILS